MKNFSTLIVAFILNSILFAQNCSDLFISEYVEGSYNNKAIEIYNPTNEAIDLSKYSLSRWSNGSTTPLNTILSGIIEANDALVIGLDKRDPNGEGYEAPLWDGWYVFTDSITGLMDSIYTDEDNLMGRVDLFICPNYEDGTMYFNGNDAVTLETAEGDIIDVIGKIGEDPGEAWGDENDAYWTKDQTLIRKASVTGGFVYDPTQPYSFDPTLEWDSLPRNTFTELGQHNCNCPDMSLSEFESVVNLYPNPNKSGLLNIESTSPIQEINIYNLIGQSVFSKNFQGLMFKESIKIDSSLNGVYFISIKLENSSRSLKKLILK